MKRLAAAAFLFVAATTAHAEAPACTGTDLLAKMQTEHPEAYAEVMQEAARIPNGDTLFWKIEREGIAPSFLLGTAHVTDSRVTTLPAGARERLDHAATVALELAELRDAQAMMAETLKNAALLVLPPGQSLWDLVPDADEPAIRDNPNLPAGGASAVYGYQPWMVAAMLSIPLCESLRKSTGIETLDGLIAAEAGTLNIPLVGLETVKEQLSTFAAMPQDQQVKYLVAVAKLGAATADYFETLISLYQQRRITAYMPFARRAQVMSADDEKLMAFVEEDLVRKRNHRMAERAAALLAKGNAFIAVGALHLPGQEGLVELLRQAGYKVSPAN
jgi:uncharacterized protein